jgi:heme/copper-type cytochrome/quinol oxidase subunit 3
VRASAALDVSGLPEYGFGHRSLLWWGTVCLIAIEATAFGLAIMTYIYLKGRVPHWPPGYAPPALVWGTTNLIIMIASCVPNQIVKKASETFDVRGVQIWMVVCMAFALAFNIVRIFEFTALNVWWDSNAYGSIVWALLGLHTVHVVTDFIDSGVLTVLFFTGPVDEHRFVDISENAMYWYFVVLTWIPIYAVIYLAPRLF